MSASLVGSEMCIRDRHSTAVVLSWCVHRCRGSQSRRAGEKDRQAIRAPVSYTHLTLPTICSV
eukprot:3677949-Alexandrium_andersonii.AAC.1